VSRRSARRREEGAFSAEFVAVLPLLLIVGAIAWQLPTVFSAGNSAAAAARNGSRAIATGDALDATVERSLPVWLREGHTVRRDGSRVEVEVAVPLVVPAVPWDGFRVSRTAELPDTSE
jgi:hypothetical protein